MEKRIIAEYINLCSKYYLGNFDYQKQYSHLYAHRLEEFTKLLVPRIKDKWGEEYAIKQLCDLREDSEDTCIVIGTIYKHQAHKPSILREISEENQLAPQPPRDHYAEDKDKVILEDNLQRVRLVGKAEEGCMATGVVCAALGCMEEDGRFSVMEYLFYETGPARPIQSRNMNKLIVLVSGLSQIDAYKYVDALNMFQHWLAGNLNETSNHVRLIIAGNSVRSSQEQRQPALQSRTDDSNHIVEAVRDLDRFLAGLSTTIPVDVMPGAHDPANFMLPQQPLHHCMFPTASAHSSFSCVTNPYACSVDDVLITGCSGQNVRDLRRCTFMDDDLEILRSTLKWGHIAPTAPDTLACYPYIDCDPFILKDVPHIYFAGNCDEFATDTYKFNKTETRLVCIPTFSKTQSVAVVNLDTLDCHEICFIENN